MELIVPTWQSREFYNYVCLITLANELLELEILYLCIKIANMEIVRSFKVMSSKFNVVGLCISGNYAQKCITK